MKPKNLKAFLGFVVGGRYLINRIKLFTHGLNYAYEWLAAQGRKEAAAVVGGNCFRRL